MTEAALSRRLGAEFIGTAMLLATVVGSGIMGERLAAGNAAVALLANTLATGAILVVLIEMFAPVSGAHFNPVVSAMFWWRDELAAMDAFAYTMAHIAGAIVGVIIAHIMFDLPAVQISLKVRSSAGQWLSEIVAAGGLILTILATRQARPQAVPLAVGLFITAAYWFTASTSFANPAVAIARGFTNTFSGIRPVDVPAFIVAELAGAALGLAVFRLIFARPAPRPAAQVAPTD